MHFKTTLMFAALAACGILCAEVTIEQQKVLKAMRERPTLISRDTTSVPGKIIEHWRNNDREYITNDVVVITGHKQHTTWSKVVEELEAEALPEKRVKQAAKKASKNLAKIIKTIEQAKKKASTDKEVELYDALLDLIGEETGE